MLEAEILAGIRRGCRNPRLATSDLQAIILRGVTFLGLHIKQADPSYFLVRKSVSSLTHVFTKPSDCVRIEAVWDLGTTAKTITGAADSAGLVRMTVSTHGFTSDNIVTQHDISGCTEANGTFKITVIDANTYDLQGSTFANAYTSGGLAYVCPTTPDKINKINLSDSTLQNRLNWYPRGDKIVVDDSTFLNDILIDYQAAPDAIADIPPQYHEGLIAFGTTNLIRIPREDEAEYKNIADYKESQRFAASMLQMVIENIKNDLSASAEPEYIRESFNKSSDFPV